MVGAMDQACCLLIAGNRFLSRTAQGLQESAIVGHFLVGVIASGLRAGHHWLEPTQASDSKKDSPGAHLGTMAELR